MRFYGEICRVDEEQRMVWGYASTTSRAEDGQTIAIEALEDALDEYMRFANIREMHQPVAVGVAREAQVDEKGIYVGAHVVDEPAWEKVKAGVYKGFSIKGPVTKRDAVDRSIVRGLRIFEISLVDRPSDPDAVFDVWRAADAADVDDEPLTNDAAREADLEDDMSRAPARKPAQAAQPAPEAAAETPAADEVQRGAEGEAAAEPAAETPATAEAAEPAAEAQAAAPETSAEEAQPAAEAPEAAAPEPTAVERALQGAAEAGERADQAVAAVERAAAGEAPTERPELPGAELRRSLSMVSRLGFLLGELTYVIYDADFEKELEGDESAVPAQLREGLRQLATAYKAMSAEEVDELLASAKVEAAVERGIVALSLGADELQRFAEAEISPDQAGRLQTLFDAFVERGWAPVMPAAAEDELTRQVASLSQDRDQLLGAVEDLTGKMTGLAETVQRLADTTPAPAKTAGVLARAVDKETDAGGLPAEAAAEPSTEDIQRVLAGMPDEERALLLTRAALARPRAITGR